MNITRSVTSNSKTKSNDKEFSPVVFDLSTLSLYCEYVLSENSNIRTSSLSTMKKLFDKIDGSIYKGDPDRAKRLEFIKRGLEARVTHKLKNKTLILQYINGGPTDKPLIDIDNFKELSNDDIEWINLSVSETIKYLFMYKYIDRIMDVCQRFKTENFKRRSDIVCEFEEIMDEAKTEFRRVKNQTSNEMMFSLADGVFEDIVSDIYHKETNPSRRLITGMQGFNLMVGGGLESGRVYMLFGTAAAGKSFTMLDMMVQIKKYNKNYICHDKTKKPCIVLLTMENSLHETVTRLYSMITGSEMVKHELNEVIDQLRSGGDMTISDGNPIDIKIVYKSNLSEDTSYLYTLYDDCEDEGFEPIAIFQDHIKRIRPAVYSRDMRLDLGEIVNEFKAFAVEKDIPVISDSHLNRDAAKILDEAARANKQDLARLLGRSNVSESMLMIDNCDVGMIITKDYDKHGNQYMGFVQIKTRTKCGIDYFAQPFVQGNPIKLVEDLNDPIPAFKTSLFDPNEVKFKNNAKNDYTGNIQRFDSDDDDNLFSAIPLGSPDDILQSIDQPSMQAFPVVGSPSQPLFPMSNIFNQPTDLRQMPLETLFELQTKYNPDARPAVYFVDEYGNTTDGIGRACRPRHTVPAFQQDYFSEIRTE